MKKSSILLLVLTLWWILPFMLGDLLNHPFLAHFSSHLLYLVTLLAALFFALVLHGLDNKLNYWEQHAFWGRYLLLAAFYAAQMVTLVAVLVLLDALGLLGYFGGDAGGSVGLVFLPSIGMYVALGAAVGLLWSLYRRICRRPPSG